MFWFCSDNKLRYRNVFAFVSISLSTASRMRERKNFYLSSSSYNIYNHRGGGIRDGELGDGDIEEGGCEIVEA
jgi:hypothetical protein